MDMDTALELKKKIEGQTITVIRDRINQFDNRPKEPYTKLEFMKYLEDQDIHLDEMMIQWKKRNPLREYGVYLVKIKPLNSVTINAKIWLVLG